jgi:hypothetical protein
LTLSGPQRDALTRCTDPVGVPNKPAFVRAQREREAVAVGGFLLAFEESALIESFASVKGPQYQKQTSINQCATNTWHVDQGNEASVAVTPPRS